MPPLIGRAWQIAMAWLARSLPQEQTMLPLLGILREFLELAAVGVI